MAIGKPPSMGISVTTKTIMGKLAEVNAEAMVLLHSRNQKIYEGVQQLTAKNVDLLERAKKLQDTVEVSDSRIRQLQAETEQSGWLIKSLKLQNEELMQQMSAVKVDSHRLRESSDREFYQIHDLVLCTP